MNKKPNDRQINYIYNCMVDWLELYNNTNKPSLRTTYYINYIQLKMQYDKLCGIYK